MTTKLVNFYRRGWPRVAAVLAMVLGKVSRLVDPKTQMNLRAPLMLNARAMRGLAWPPSWYVKPSQAAYAVGAAVITTWALPGALVPSASAQPCPDVEVAFARGTGEQSGVGPTGQAFIDALRPRIGGRSFDVYPVNYPASDEWSTGLDGIKDAGAHVVSTAKNCPRTKMVLGGYSQGAAVMGFVTSAAVPDGVDPATVPKPLAPGEADHVAAVVLFGMPNVRAMNFLGEPPVVIGPSYQAKTIKVCVPEDPVCSDGLNFAAHDTYATDASMVDKGADFAGTRLDAVR